MKNIFILSLSTVLIFISFSTIANISYVEPEWKNDEKPLVNTVNIFFDRDVTKSSIVELRLAIDNINTNYSQVKLINLFMSGGGNDLDSGLIGSFSIKSSSIPIKIINNGAVTSSAAIELFCSSKDRYMMKNTWFLLHPAALVKDGYMRIYPDEIERMNNTFKIYNKNLLDTYSSCTTYSDKEIQGIIKSEYFSKYLNAQKAQKFGLVKDEILELPAADMTIYINETIKK